jgi:diaminopimelate epimerase
MIRFAKAHAWQRLPLRRRGTGRGRNAARPRAGDGDRHAGIGADGLIVYVRTSQGARMRLFNADGGRAEVSGNGVRGLAAWLLHTSDEVASTLTIETEAGAKKCQARTRGEPADVSNRNGLPSDLRQVTLQADGVADAVEPSS